MGNRTLPAPDLTPVDLTDHDVFVDGVPHEWFAWLRRHEPVSFTPEPTGRSFWSVTRHADIVEVSRDWRTFSSQTGATALEDLAPDALAARLSMLDADPPLHTQRPVPLSGDPELAGCL
jgi:cholest-4-en-3-one 26-monooxygenase